MKNYSTHWSSSVNSEAQPPRIFPIHIFPDAESLASALSSIILDDIEAASAGNRRYLLGCPGGRSAAETYRVLGRDAASRNIDMSCTVVVMMDNYVEARDNEFVHCPDDAHYSCVKFAREKIREVINRDLPDDRRIPDESVWFPDPRNPMEYELRIEDAGGIDLFLVASGATDGHVAFNPPGSARTARTRIIELAETTRRDNLGTFPEFSSIDEVPRYGVSVGIDTIVSHSRKVACVIHGVHKRLALHETVARRKYDPDWPISLIHEASTIGIFTDEAAAGTTDLSSYSVVRGVTRR